jgi:small nuclear ribonucleoprotein (snRNP)-like protein
MDEMYHLCMKHVNRRVRVHTRCGQCYEGVIVNVDRDNVYLKTSEGVRTSGKVHTSGWFGFGPSEGILALSLFTLLAIALI